jgi:hypothetical protein
MDDKEMKIREKQIAKAVTKSFEQLIHDLENAPKLIFEVEEQAEENEQTINEITSWLFEGRHEDGYSDNNVHN